MGSLTLNVQKKQHRERAQPLERRKLGMLEKKKDYKLRSQDFHAKEAQLKLLRKKAQERNPDEYYHEMSHSRREDDGSGVLVYDQKKGPAASANGLTADAVKLLKTQDSSYVQTHLSHEQNNIKRLENDLIFGSVGNHTIFVDSEKQADEFKPEEYFDTDKKLLNRRENRLRRRQLERQGGIVIGTDSASGIAVADSKSTTLDATHQKDLNKKRLAKYQELEQRMEREAQLLKVKKEMDLQRELLKKGARRKVTDKDGYSRYVWSNERKR